MENQNNLEKYSNEYYEKNKELIKKKTKEYYEKNKESLNKKRKERYVKNKEQVLINRKKYYEKNIESIKEYKKVYRENNKEVINSYIEKNKEVIKNYNKNYKNERRLNDPLYKLSHNIRNSINKSLKIKGYIKESRTHKILGCSYEHFKEYIESFFIEERSWMNWGNYGNPKDGLYEPNKTWDIDHIIPTSSANNEKELLELNHYTNLQPLCSYYNRFVKKDNY